MFYPFHHQQPIIILNQQSFDWIGLLNFIAVAVIGYFAWRISQRQAEIAQKQSDLEDYADTFVRPHKRQGTESWTLQVRSACPRVIYLSKITFEGEKNRALYGEFKFSRDKKATLPIGEENYYSFPLYDPGRYDQDVNGVATLYFDIEFFDVLGKKHISHHAGWFQESVWVIHNLKSEVSQ